MQPTIYQIAIISVGSAIVGAVVGAWIAYKFAICLSIKNAKREAGRRLIDAFAPELSNLDPVRNIKQDEINHILENAFPRHHRAMVEFGFYLPDKYKKEYKDTCEKYYKVAGSVRFFDYYMEPNGLELFQERVQAILEYIKKP